MKRRLTRVVVSLCVLGMISAPAFAAASNDNVSARTAALEQQVAELQKEIAAMQGQKTVSYKKKKSAASTSTKEITPPASASSPETRTKSAPSVKAMPTTGTTYIPVDLDVPGQSFVSSGPYIGIPLEYSGSNLIINAPSIDQDVALLQVRKNIHQRLHAMGITEEPDRAHVLLSGIVEGQAAYQNMTGGTDNSSIDLTSAGLDAYILGPSSWVSGLISLNYDNFTGASEGSLDSNSRTANSRVVVNQAFVTIGDFTQSPTYGSFGQVNVPFGRYSTNMVTAPLTKDLARVKARAITVGYQPQKDDAIYAAVYGFQGDSHVGNASRVNNGGIDLGYKFKQGVFSGDLGGGVIANLADSVGMQLVGNSTTFFNGFGGITSTAGINTGNEQLVHRVAAYDMRAMGQIGDNIDLLGEYVTAAQQFSEADLMMKSHGAAPQALNAEAAYTFIAFTKPSSVALDYGMTKDSLALGLPMRRYGLVFNTSIWRDTLQSLEFRHDTNYATSITASGSGVPAAPESSSSDNAVTAQFDMYF